MRRLVVSGAGSDERTVQTFNDLLRVYNQAADLTSSENLVSRMKEFNITPTANTYNELLRGYSNKGMIDEATNLFEQMVFLLCVHIYSIHTGIYCVFFWMHIVL